MDFFDVIRTQRAMRRLKPDPVSDEDLWTILDAAIHAPSGGNTQGWNFVVIRDRAVKEKIGAWYLEAWDRAYGPRRDAMLEDAQAGRMFRSADYLANHLADVPALILATLQNRTGFGADVSHGASIYPAVQNLMLAARALGLGTTLTTLHRLHEQDVRELLGIPADVDTMALIPVGHPRGRFGEPQRVPAEKVTYWDRWGERKTRGG
ncbi:MAG: nitroreductase family protein [Dehalococcoidia bacterium]|nr:nitroreductase family protein [Dehalococcoidia bacterium]